MTHPPTRPYVWMLCGSFAFTLMAELAHVLTRACDWQAVAVARAGGVAALAGLMAYLGGAKLVFLRPRRLWVRSVAGSCSMVCTFYAFSRLPTADVLTLTNTFPLWVVVFGWPVSGERPNGRTVAAVLVGLCGVVLVEQPHLEAGNAGVVAALAAAAMTAVAMLGLHSLRGVDPRAVVVHFSAVATAVCGAAYLVGPRLYPAAGLAEPEVVWRLGGMAAAATVGQLLLTLAFAAGAPARVSVVGLSQVVMALGFDAWLWGRELNAVTLLGTALVIAPTAWLLVRPRPNPK